MNGETKAAQSLTNLPQACIDCDFASANHREIVHITSTTNITTMSKMNRLTLIADDLKVINARSDNCMVHDLLTQMQGPTPPHWQHCEVWCDKLVTPHCVAINLIDSKVLGLNAGQREHPSQAVGDCKGIECIC